MPQMLIPASVPEACAMLAAGDCAACAGATNLYVDRQNGKLNVSAIVSLHQLEELKKFERDVNGWHVGSLTVFDTLEEKFDGRQPWQALSEAAAQVGGPQIRNRGTIGGNILSASPAADTVPVLMVLDARLVLTGIGGTREVPVNGFMKGPGKTDIRADEVLTEIILPEKKGRAAFRKVGKRNAMAISVLNMAVYMETEAERITNIAVAVGSAGPTALRACHAETLLMGKTKPASEAEWRKLLTLLIVEVEKDITPIDDIRATASYRRKIAGNIAAQLVRDLWEGTDNEDKLCH